MSDDVFNTDDQGDNNENPLADLVGEDKKFKTVEDLAKGKLEADTFIEQLKTEGEVMRTKLAELEGKGSKEDTVAELLKAVREHQKTEGGDDDNQVSDADLSKRIKEIMRGETEAETAAKNRSIANQTVLDKVNGDVEAAKVYLAERAKQLHMSVKELRELGEKSPEAFTKLIDGDTSTVSKGITELEGHADNSGSDPVKEIDGHKTKAWYDAYKKEVGPAKYWNDVKIQGQYAKDAMALKERFNQ